MSISSFFSSLAGMYAAQSFCHALIASVIMDQAVRAWKIDDPAVRQRFRLAVIFIPVFSFPAYQFADPDRGSVVFRLDALFDSNRWINVELWGTVPLGHFLLALLIITSLIFLFQELIPIVRHTADSRAVRPEGVLRDPDPFLEAAARGFSIATPDVTIIEDDEPLIFSTTGKNPVIFISSGLSRTLTPEELRAALAHELGHIARSRRPLLIAVFFLRMALFFNPVALIEFRRVVRNEEKICDDIAVSLTGDPGALAGALKKFYVAPKPREQETGRKPLITPVRLEEYSFNIQLAGRISRLSLSGASERRGRWGPFTLAVLVIAVVNYFVV